MIKMSWMELEFGLESQRKERIEAVEVGEPERPTLRLRGEGGEEEGPVLVPVLVMSLLNSQALD